jgi:hypothetical protein
MASEDNNKIESIIFFIHLVDLKGYKKFLYKLFHCDGLCLSVHVFLFQNINPLASSIVEKVTTLCFLPL